MGEGNCARAGMATRSLRVERADALSDVSYRNYASDQSRAQISRNLGAMHSAAVSNPLPTPYPPPLLLLLESSQLQSFSNRYLEPRRTY